MQLLRTSMFNQLLTPKTNWINLERQADSDVRVQKVKEEIPLRQVMSFGALETRESSAFSLRKQVPSEIEKSSCAIISMKESRGLNLFGWKFPSERSRYRKSRRRWGWSWDGWDDLARKISRIPCASSGETLCSEVGEVTNVPVSIPGMRYNGIPNWQST